MNQRSIQSICEVRSRSNVLSHVDHLVKRGQKEGLALDRVRDFRCVRMLL